VTRAAALALALLLAGSVRADEPPPSEAQIETWIRDALAGPGSARDEAVRRLAALGGRALDRLFEEVARAARSSSAPPAPPTTPGRMVLYDLADLVLGGVTAETIEGLLSGVGGVVATRRGNAWEVRASDEAHVAIRARFAALRSRLAAPSTPAPPEPEAEGPPADFRVIEVVLPTEEVPPAPVVLTFERGERWLADTRGTARELDIILHGAGRGTTTPFTYRRDAVKAPDGGWKAEEAVIDEGSAARLTLRRAGDGLRLHVVVTRTEVARPVPTVAYRPAPDAEPVTLDSPQWSSTSAEASADLPASGGVALLPLPGLSPSADRQVVLFVRIAPRAP
jgi:hypothetical protein